MIQSNKWYIIFLVLIFAIFFHPMISFAKQKVSVEVAGLSCPFCAFGLEKKLKNIHGAEKVTIKINEGKAEIDLAEGKRITKEEVEQAVKDSGFTPGKIVIYEDKEGSP